jgi:hypothetical protein
MAARLPEPWRQPTIELFGSRGSYWEGVQELFSRCDFKPIGDCA